MDAITYSITTNNKLSEQLQKATKDSAESLAPFQPQITSIAQVVLQNHRALNLFTADKGDTSRFPGKECCYNKESGQKKLGKDLRWYDQSTSSPLLWGPSSLSAWLTLLGDRLLSFVYFSF